LAGKPKKVPSTLAAGKKDDKVKKEDLPQQFLSLESMQFLLRLKEKNIGG